MSVTVEQLPEEKNIVVATYGNPFSADDVAITMTETTQYYDPAGPTLYSISDASQLDLSFSDLVMALAGATRTDGWKVGAPNSVTIFVGSNELVRMGREALKQQQYGAVEVELFESLDAALDWVRSQA